MIRRSRPVKEYNLIFEAKITRWLPPPLKIRSAAMKNKGQRWIEAGGFLHRPVMQEDPFTCPSLSFKLSSRDFLDPNTSTSAQKIGLSVSKDAGQVTKGKAWSGRTKTNQIRDKLRF